MPLDRSRFVASVDLYAVRSALSEWSWLLREGVWDPLLVSASGDVFLAHDSCEIFHLDTGAGELTRIAGTVAEFDASLEDPEVAKNWLLTPVVDELLNSGRNLDRGQCFGFTILPVFKEGSYAAANRRARRSAQPLDITRGHHGHSSSPILS